jgi:hypothetical protein
MNPVRSVGLLTAPLLDRERSIAPPGFSRWLVPQQRRRSISVLDRCFLQCLQDSVDPIAGSENVNPQCQEATL